MSLVDETVQSYQYQIVLVYASNGCPLPDLVLDIEKIIKPNLPTMVIGDFNFDTKKTNAFTQFMKISMFTQIVSWPTHEKGNIIDHCYVSNNSHVQLKRHSPYYSDHNALCIKFDNIS